MKIGVLGTGMVGESIGSKLIEVGHEVKMGSRTSNNEKAQAWADKNGARASHGTFADAAAFGEVIFNCSKGEHSIEVLNSAGAQNLEGKILADLSNPLDFSKGMPPSLLVSNTSSLAEEIQKAFPQLHVVKTLNTLNATLMVNPSLINGGDHNIFIGGNDAAAKSKVKEILQQFGWHSDNIIDLGDISSARGTEQILPIWIRIMQTLNTPMFQFKIVK